MTLQSANQKNSELRILVVKLTSMGDALHLLPALSDLSENYPKAKVDWMIEDSFVDIPTWHKSVDKIIPVSTRRWRKFTLTNLREFWAFFKQLRARRYDLVLDAQGLMKSSGLGWLAKLNRGGKRIGFSADSIKEKPAARFYHIKILVERQLHAIDRIRQLFAQALDYPLVSSSPKYSINLPMQKLSSTNQPSIFFFPGTTWPSKHIPDSHWRELAELILDDGYQIKISWGTDAEKLRAQWIAQDRANIDVLPKSSLTELACLLHGATGAIAVDTGLGHLAAGLGVPAVSVYGATNSKLTGAKGEKQILLQSDYPCSPCFLKECNKLNSQVITPPCYLRLGPADIWQALYQQIV